jgi:hypothetical protein
VVAEAMTAKSDRRLALEARFRAHDERRAAEAAAPQGAPRTALEQQAGKRLARVTRAAKGNTAAIMACRVSTLERLAAVRDVIKAAQGVERVLLEM